VVQETAWGRLEKGRVPLTSPEAHFMLWRLCPAGCESDSTSKNRPTASGIPPSLPLVLISYSAIFYFNTPYELLGVPFPAHSPRCQRQFTSVKSSSENRTLLFVLHVESVFPWLQHSFFFHLPPPDRWNRSFGFRGSEAGCFAHSAPRLRLRRIVCQGLPLFLLMERSFSAKSISLAFPPALGCVF